ncbi:Acetoacetyl-CoA synthetase [Oopsacas minuta]|uniref:Acetoacetyl-CoA synthetase n=1 Tax=Oopsacas minuta TaxID=111878 RepID=A0AAV7KF77_9METZ|nr:Acetoacetyl-CoA synthetase [Oopsacas minuta]
MTSTNPQYYQSVNCVVIGDGNIGKTCLVTSFLENAYNLKHVPTVFDSYSTTQRFNGKEYDLQIKDTAGQEEYERLRPLVYSDADCFLLCFSVVNRNSFDNVLTKWVQEIHHFAPKKQFILVGLKTDLRHHEKTCTNLIARKQTPVNYKEGSDLAKRLRKNAISLQSFLAGHVSTGDIIEFVQVPFNHPLYIMFSSGTTGPPKCMVHSVGGTLLQHMKEHMLHGNMTYNDVIIYYSTTGWMMWNWLVSALSVGSAIVLYDGSPFVPTPAVLFDLIDKIGITVLGTGAKWISALQERRVEPIKTHKLSTLHTILSTGSPLKPDNFRYVYKSIKKQNPKLPVFAGEIQARNLGMAVESWNEKGQPVFNRSGELVVTKPFPSQPTHFMNDPGNNKYNKAYFNGYPDVWTHGDFCMINERTGGLVMLGRSDSTLNPSGVRFGSAEIYSIVEMNEEIEDSLCIGQPFKGDERVILFLKMSSDYKLSEELIQKVKLQIRNELSARHVPHLIYETQEIPYTTNGKKVEVAVKRVLCGEEVKSRGSLVNPDSLDLYADMYSTFLKSDPN